MHPFHRNGGATCWVWGAFAFLCAALSGFDVQGIEVPGFIVRIILVRGCELILENLVRGAVGLGAQICIRGRSMYMRYCIPWEGDAEACPDIGIASPDIRVRHVFDFRGELE
jgi:hypothetical protein